MMEEKSGFDDRRPSTAPMFLICDTLGDPGILMPGGQRVSSPVQCLDLAITERPGIMVIRFGPMPIRQREALVELCVVLKHNRHTGEIPLLALLSTKHRQLIEALKDAGADYIRYIGMDKLESALILQCIEGLGPRDRIEPHLAILCPFLHYSRIDSQHEITVCGAYLDRMVLGGRRLHEICEVENHLQCEYYLNPRLAS